MAAANDKSRPKRAPRFPVTPKGEVIEDGKTLRAIVQDVSDSGLLFVCSKEFEPGQILGLRLQLSAGSFVDCEIEVRHSNDMGTGARIVAMDDLNRRVYERYLQEFFSTQLGKSG
jgi:hypothetical protein